MKHRKCHKCRWEQVSIWWVGVPGWVDFFLCLCCGKRMEQSRGGKP